MSAISEPADIGARHLAKLAQNWAPESRAAMVEYLRVAQKRDAIKSRYKNVTELASAIDPNFIVTPALALIGRKIEMVLNRKRHNLLITTPPQEGKSTIAAVYTPLRSLQLHPNNKIILATYGETLALEHSQNMRTIISRHGSGVIDAVTSVEVEDKLGFQINPASNRVDAWRISNGRGGITATGLHGAITGRAADLFIIDDPYKDMVEADSLTHRERVNDWMRSVARTRLSPQASIILIQTRWHPEDLAGEIISKEKLLPPEYRTWHHINIPAIAEEGIDDALGREPGTVMVSARGRTLAEFEATRRDVGERVWYALYQGNPRNPAGGLFARKWFEPHMEVPEHPVAAVVAVDPADSGKDDETGIIGGYLCPDGKVLLAEDWSGQFTSDKWGRQAVLLALQMGAREIAMEAYTTGTTYVNVIKNAWRDIHREAVKKAMAGAELTPVERRACREQMPFTIYKWRGRFGADAVARSSLIRQAFETHTCRTVEHRLAVFEDMAADWQVGQHQPDRVAAALIAHDRLAHLASGKMIVAVPTDRSLPEPGSRSTTSMPGMLNTVSWRRKLSG